MVSRDDSIEVSYGWVVIFVSLALHSIALGAPNVLFVSLKPIAADLGSLRSVPSFAYSLLMIGAGVGGLAMGFWMDRRGIVQPVLFGSVMIGFGAIVASQSESRWGLYVANGLLIGLLGKAAMIAPLVSNATRWFDRRRGLAVAIIASGQGVAGAIWPPVIQSLNALVGWRETYLYFGLFAFASMIPLALMLRHKAAAAAVDSLKIDGDGGLVLGLRPNLVQFVLCLATVCCCAAMAMPIVHLVSHATDLGLMKVHAAELLSYLFVAAFFSRIAFGVLVDWIGAFQTLLIGSTCQMTMLIVFAIVESQTGLYIAAVMFGLGFAGIMPCYPSIIRILFPADQLGWRVACQYLFASLGMALGGWLGGVIFDLAGSYAEAFFAGAGFNAVNLILASFLFIRRNHNCAMAQIG
jgi:MFS family permease|tara:strand:+ start:549 stop:1775 length:1227 start_codon:yes stop_codon:yes gene_type:complete